MSSFRDTLAPELAYLYSKALKDVEEYEHSRPPMSISAKEVLRAHFSIVSFFTARGGGIGGVGPRDTGLLISAISRQSVGFGREEKWTTIEEKAATLLFGLIQNHPFFDANKRTAFLSTVHYLFCNGYLVTCRQKEIEDFTVLVADNGLNRFPRYRELRKKNADPEIRFIAYWLKKNTRKMDRKQYLVTYRELEKILRRYDAWLENPHDNQIDVMHWVEVETVSKSLFGKSRKTMQKEVRRACVLGFPGWSRQVGKGRLKHIRETLNLTIENGIDSQSFFQGVDDMAVLLELYEGALRRLADR